MQEIAMYFHYFSIFAPYHIRALYFVRHLSNCINVIQRNSQCYNRVDLSKYNVQQYMQIRKSKSTMMQYKEMKVCYYFLHLVL